MSSADRGPNILQPFLEEASETADSWGDYLQAGIAALAAYAVLMAPVLFVKDPSQGRLAAFVCGQAATIFVGCSLTGAALARVRLRATLLRDVMPDPLVLLKATVLHVVLVLPADSLLWRSTGALRTHIRGAGAGDGVAALLGAVGTWGWLGIALWLPLKLVWLLALVRVVNGGARPFRAIADAIGMVRGAPAAALGFAVLWALLPGLQAITALVLGSVAERLWAFTMLVGTVALGPYLYGVLVRFFAMLRPLEPDAVFLEYVEQEHVLGAIREQLEAERAALEERFPVLHPEPPPAASPSLPAWSVPPPPPLEPPPAAGPEPSEPPRWSQGP